MKLFAQELQKQAEELQAIIENPYWPLEDPRN